MTFKTKGEGAPENDDQELRVAKMMTEYRLQTTEGQQENEEEQKGFADLQRREVS